jgi:organic radical activating enzyme
MRQTGIRKWWQGTNVTIFVTYRCNLLCSYCSLLDPVPGKRPESKIELSPEEWVEKIRVFPVNVRDVYITGGEPTLYRGLEFLVNNLLGRGYRVLVFTNLRKSLPFEFCTPSRRFKIQATYHKCADPKEFDKNYQRLKSLGYRIEVDEFDKKTFTYSHLKNYDNEERWKIANFRYSADGQLFTCVWDHVKGMAK